MIPYCRTDVYRNSFFPSAIRLWNQLPETIVAAPTLDDFKMGLASQDKLCTDNFYPSLYPPANFVCRGYTVFTLSVRASVRPSVRPCVRPSVRPSVTLCFLNYSKSHCRIFIKPCKHVHICKTNTLDKKVRARGQFY